MGTLTLYYHPIANLRETVYHITIGYYSPTLGNQYITMGPSIPNTMGPVDSAIAAVANLPTVRTNSPGPWGTLVAKTGTYVPGDRLKGVDVDDNGKEVPKSVVSTSLSDVQFNTVKNTMMGMNSLGLTYHPSIQNSNGGACTGLSKVGISIPNDDKAKWTPGCTVNLPTNAAEKNQRLQDWLDGSTPHLMVNQYNDIYGYTHTNLNFVDGRESDREFISLAGNVIVQNVSNIDMNTIVYQSTGLDATNADITLAVDGLSVSVSGNYNDVIGGVSNNVDVYGSNTKVDMNSSFIDFFGGTNNGVIGDWNFGDNWDWDMPDEGEYYIDASGKGTLGSGYNSDTSKLIEAMAAMGSNSGYSTVTVRPINSVAMLVAATAS